MTDQSPTAALTALSVLEAANADCVDPQGAKVFMSLGDCKLDAKRADQDARPDLGPRRLGLAVGKGDAETKIQRKLSAGIVAAGRPAGLGAAVLKAIRG